MFKNLFQFTVVALLGLTPIGAGATFIPMNLQETPQEALREANMTEAEFRGILTQVQKIYAPIASLHGGRLSVGGSWNSKTLNAGARQMFGFWQVDITGALARRPELTKDGFTLIVCHELGHHLGGYAFAPADNPLSGTWAAGEGQSDYFSTQVCARKLWGSDHVANEQSVQSVSSVVRKACSRSWNNSQEQNLCFRTLAAAESMTTTMANLMKKPIPKFETPDANVVTATSSRHPAVQCRLDTVMQGALCVAPFDDKVIPGKKASGGKFGVEAEREAAANSCMTYSNYNVGLRPACWFKAQL